MKRRVCDGSCACAVVDVCAYRPTADRQDVKPLLKYVRESAGCNSVYACISRII
jgi:hypothetical protein